jgi:hypothetical protein
MVKSVVLPLYSVRRDGTQYVPEKSGINQWNAKGRIRRFGEAYIPIPSIIHQIAPDFFPDRDRMFELVLPNEIKVDAKVCQAGSKALMSNPNRYLCKWLYSLIEDEAESIRRYQLGIPFAMADLTKVNIGCIEITKESDKYFAKGLPVGAYEIFKLRRGG